MSYLVKLYGPDDIELFFNYTPTEKEEEEKDGKARNNSHNQRSKEAQCKVLEQKCKCSAFRRLYQKICT